MKNYLLLCGIVASIFFTSCKPDAQKILNESLQKCQSIENGYYEMTYYMKYMSGNDTTSTSFMCNFKKLPDDTIYSSSFHYQYSTQGEFSRGVLYTGDDFIKYSLKDSTGEIMSKNLWAKEIKLYSHNYTFYSPITNRKSYPLPNESDLMAEKHTFQLIGEEMVNEFSCYHIKVSFIPEKDSADMMEALSVEKDFWINKADLIPVQFTISADLVEMNVDTMNQFEKYVLTKYDLNGLNDTSLLTIFSVPSFINLKDYVPYKRPELLTANTTAPEWTLKSLKNETLNLSNFKGKLVLIDFFYKSCYPCMLALPALQNLHEKYFDQGLRVIGIDPYDTKEKDDIENFLEKRGVTYTVLLGGRDVAKDYHVPGYPTTYLIDKSGKILLSQVGFGDSTEVKLEEIIKENLSK